MRNVCCKTAINRQHLTTEMVLYVYAVHWTFCMQIQQEDPELNASKIKKKKTSHPCCGSSHLISPRCNTQHLNCSFVLTATKLLSTSPVFTEAKSRLRLCKLSWSVFWTKSTCKFKNRFFITGHNYDLMMTDKNNYIYCLVDISIFWFCAKFVLNNMLILDIWLYLLGN